MNALSPRAALVAVLVVVVLLTGVVIAIAARESAVWVAVTGPQGSEPPEELVLEIGNTAWHGYGGVASVQSFVALRVRLMGTAGCNVYADFVAPPRTSWVIRFLPDGSTTVEDWSGRAMEAGPALGARPATGCP